MIYLLLFFSFLQVGLFSIGGGYAILPMIQSVIVEGNHWLTPSEYNDLIAISQMTPGPIAINAATFVGMKMAGFPGAVCATLGSVTAPSCISLIFAVIYQKYKSLKSVEGILKGLRPCVTGLIASAGVSYVLEVFWLKGKEIPVDIFAIALFAICFAMFRRKA
ncbi:MAG: chromate transporter, partial [Clostridiales bacterium]|nr:chromate transporter [Clostridiales bacterium]